MEHSQESLYTKIAQHNLHIRRFCQSDNSPVVVMFHGVIEDGAIFYKDYDKGLANYLASQGYDVYVVNFRGRGGSTPTIKQDSNHDQFDVIVRDIPHVIDYIFNKTNKKMHVICHSWGGVLFSSSYVRSAGFNNRISSITCFGTKRRVSVWNMDRVLKVTLFWNNLAPLIARKRGFLDAKRLRIGSAPETRNFIKQSVVWVRNKHWVDPVDKYDYYSEAKKLSWPPTWYLTGVNDKSLGHAKDVHDFLKETQHPEAKFTVLSKQNGNLVDYDHIDILTHKLAPKDHFISIRNWIESASAR